MATIRIKNPVNASKYKTERRDSLCDLLQEERTRSENLMKENDELRRGLSHNPKEESIKILGEISVRVLKVLSTNPQAYVDTREANNNDGVLHWMVSTCRNCGGHSSYSSWEPDASKSVKHLEDCPYGMIEQIIGLADEIETNKKGR